MSEPLPESELADRIGWMGGARKAFYRAENLWVYGALQQLDLVALSLQFAHLGPLKFKLELSGECVALRVFDDVCVVGIGQVTDESWLLIRELKAADHLSALAALQPDEARGTSAEEQAHVDQLH